MALGALIIKEKCGFSDRETVEQIMGNPYLQYFIGLKEFQDEAPFDPSLMVHFRKRLGLETIKEINELICQPQPVNDDDEDRNDKQDPEVPQQAAHHPKKGKGKNSGEGQ